VDIAEWLKGLDLSQYASAFADNDIDEQILSELTAEDLAAIGVASVGHRRRLLSAIAALRGPATPLASPPAASSIPAEAERRQLTVMFCDLVGSTALASRVDPEDLREVVAGYHRAVSGTVSVFAGFVAKYMGDGVLVYFGYPHAHEDDAERAVRAGLAVIEAVRDLPAPERLQARIGVATGLAVVGDLIGEGAAQERGVVGETPNLAARLQALAGPDGVIVSDATRRQIGSLFELHDLGAQSLAGFAEPQRAWRVIAESGAVSRFEALRSTAAPLVGRDEELDLLRRRWEQAKTGEGRAVLLSGEPGIGKSRLTAAISEAIAAEPHTRLRYFCSPHHQDSALHPIIVHMERAAGFARGEAPGEKLAKLQALLAPAAPTEAATVLVAELLSLPNAAADLNLSPQRKREMLFESLLHPVEVIARHEPVLMVFEDVHWIDPTSRELLDLVISRVARMPVLLIVTFRPEFQPPWIGQPHVTLLALNRLDRRDVAALVLGIAGNAPLGGAVLDEIVERTDGVPLFVEELTKAVIERADQDDRVAAVLSASPLATLAVPSTLHASLIARLDRIGAAAREVAQVGSVLGREFSYELIERVARRSDTELQPCLARLEEAGLLFCRGAPPHASYLFKHALVQDAAYGTLLRARRQELHARVAGVLETDFADLVERQPELLAHHLTAAGDNECAVEQWLRAGQRAAARLAHVEAIAHLGRGLALLQLLPEMPARDDREIELRLALGVSLIVVNGIWSPSVTEVYGRARELAEQRCHAQQLFEATYGLWQQLSNTRPSDSRHLSARLLQLSSQSQDDGLHLQAHHSGWTTSIFCGELAQAQAHCTEGRRLYDPNRHASHRYIYGGHDPGCCARYTAGQVEWLLGYPDRAAAAVSEAISLADYIAHPFTREVGVEYAAHVHLHRGDPDRALSYIVASDQLRTEQRLSFVIEPAVLRASAHLAQGAVAEAVATLDPVFESGLRGAWQPYGFAIFAAALMRQGGYAQAAATLRQGFDRIEATGERVWEAELCRVNGLVLLGGNEIEAGQNLMRQAVRIAQAQQAKSLELRAATELARLLGEQGRRAEAHELLAPVYGWFTEGFDTADLKEAKALLDALA